MKPICKFANTDFDLVEAGGDLYAITAYGHGFAYAFKCTDAETAAPKPNDYHLFPKAADNEPLYDFILGEVDHFKPVAVNDADPHFTRAKSAADWLFK